MPNAAGKPQPSPPEIGFWKNWASCNNSNGKQAPVLDQTLALFPIGVNQTTHGFYLGTLYVDTCAEAVSLLNKSTLNGKKSASDPIFNMTAQLVAALLNLKAGAATCGNLDQTIAQALTLLSVHNFNGNTYTPKLTAAEATYANQLATILDNYNNTSACPGAAPPPAP